VYTSGGQRFAAAAAAVAAVAAAVREIYGKNSYESSMCFTPFGAQAGFIAVLEFQQQVAAADATAASSS
jgi:hypothetical protein